MSEPAASALAAGDSGDGGRHRRGWRVLVVVLAVLGVYALLGFVVAPRIAQGQLTERLAAELGRPVSIGGVRFNPFTLVLRVDDFSVSEPAGGGELAGFAQFEADASWRSLYRLAPVLSSIVLHEPRLHLARDATGRTNIQDLLDKWAARPPSPPGPAPRFSMTNIVVDGGRFVFDDARLDERHEVTGVVLRIPFVSSLPVDETVHVEPSLRARIDGAALGLDGRVLPFSATHESMLDLDLDGIDLARFVGYAPAALPFELRSARLESALKLVFSQAEGAAPSIAVTGSAKLASIDLRQPGGAPLLAAESIAAEAISLAWPANRYTIGRVTVDALAATVVRRQGERRFLEPVLAAIERDRGAAATRAGPANAAARSAGEPAAPTTPTTPTTGPQWSIDEVVLARGRLAFEDAQFLPKPLRLDASAIEATLRRLASDPAVPADFELVFALAGGEHAKLSGTASWQEGAVDAQAQLSGIALAHWWWMAEPVLSIDAVGGQLALDARVRVEPVRDGPTAIRVDEGSARLVDLALRQRWDKRTLLTLPQFDLDQVSIDFAQRRIALGTLAARAGQLLVRRDRDARWNLQQLLADDRSSASTAAAPEAGADGAAAGPARPATRVGASAGEATPPWTISLGKLAVSGFGVDLQDERGGKAAQLRASAIDIGASGLSSAEGAPAAKVELRARVDRRGTLSLGGELGLKPLAGTLRVAARDLVIVPLQPYFSEYVNLLVSSGSVSAGGSLRFAIREQAAPHIGWKGRVSVADFAAVSKEANDDLLRWRSLAFDQVDFDSEPLKVDVGGIVLEDLYARVILSAEGRLNLRELLVDHRAAPAAAPTEAPAAAPAFRAASGAASASGAAPTEPPAQRKLRVGGVRLVNGNIDFSDFFVKPNYSANLTGMNGQVSQITPGQAGDLELRGRVDHTGSVEILGNVNPLADPLSLDLKASARDIDLPRLSPYSGKYIGYGIEKGKLSASVTYKVENRQLSAENNIVLDQLTFGDKVDSPDALELPVLFAVSLLKDRNGVIDVNLPVSGSLDDPQFSIGGIVLRIIGNLIVKAVTAPFALIANLAGASGAELSWIGFQAGSPDLDAAALGKLQSIAWALTDRPGLKLDLAGRADPVADREALRRLALQRVVKAQKLKETVSGGGDVAAVDKVRIDPQEYPKYLELAWRAAKFDKPRNVIGLVKSQPAAEMERMMLAHIGASDTELIALANARAQRVKDWLADSGKVPGERMFIVTPRLGAAASAAEGAAREAPPAGAAPAARAAPANGSPREAPPLSRVDLSLK